MNISDITANLGFFVILTGITIALFQWQRRKVILSCLTLGLFLVAISQIMNGRNEAMLLIILVLVGSRKLFVQEKFSKK